MTNAECGDIVLLTHVPDSPEYVWRAAKDERVKISDVIGVGDVGLVINSGYAGGLVRVYFEDADVCVWLMPEHFERCTVTDPPANTPPPSSETAR
jgi:hypothetical protein